VNGDTPYRSREDHPLGPVVRVHEASPRGLALYLLAQWAGTMLGQLLGRRPAWEIALIITAVHVALGLTAYLLWRRLFATTVTVRERGLEFGKTVVPIEQVREIDGRWFVRVRLASNEKLQLPSVREQAALVDTVRARVPRLQRE